MFRVGQRVIRYMGIAGGFWSGHVQEVTSETSIRVAFGWRPDDRHPGQFTYDISMPFDVDEYLFPWPESDEERQRLRALIRHAIELAAPINAALDEPQWPAGFWGEQNGS